MRTLTTASVLALILSASSGTLLAQATNASTTARNKATVERSFNAWKDGTGSPFDLLTENAPWTIVGRSVASKTYENREAFMRDVIRPFNARMAAPLRPEVRQIVADGDTVVIFFDARGTAHGGTPYTNTYAWFLTMRDDKVVKAVAFFDSIEFNELWSRVKPATP